ncbi:hypothetical protein OsI_18554 [Oryza sativa Indica Group]|uniref:Uncharacterized protein n=1 Tax=Oryza sativa subsp. indica TaxID=39946 RepID=B8AYE0_ORYSI|nr:hypothetical protein OsI_18554 [Oryza sativa Indica Group]
MPLSRAQRKRRIEQRWHPCNDAMIPRTQAHMPMTQNGRGTRPPRAELMQPRDRFKVLKNHAMQEDINPCFFYAVTGYFDYRAENRPRHKESAASSILGEIPKPLKYTHLVGGQQDRDSLKRQTADCSMSLGESSSIPKIARSILGEIPKPLRYTHQYNRADLAVVYEEAIFFVLQAYNEEVIHLSMRIYRWVRIPISAELQKWSVPSTIKSIGSLTVPNVLVGMQTLPVEKKAGSSCSPAMNSKGEEDSSKLEEPKASKTPEYRMEKKAGSSCSHALNSKGKEESSGRLGKEPQASRANNPVLLSTPKSRSQGIKHKPQTGEKAASSRCSTAFNSKRGEDSSGCSSVSVPIGAMMINVNLLD